MKRILTFLSNHKKSHIYCAAAIFIAAVLLILKNNSEAVNYIVDNITTPFKGFLGTVFSVFPFSVMEIILILVFLSAIVYLILWIVSVIRGERKLSKFYSGLLGIVMVVLTIYDLLYFLWGYNYYSADFCEKAGIVTRESTVEELYDTTAYFADNFNKLAAEVPRDEKGEFSVSLDSIFEDSTSVYDNISKIYPFLSFHDKIPKPMMFSHIMSAINYTGVYFPLTGESNININPPACTIPYTVSHELAHRRGIFSEKECNFLGVLAAVSSDNVNYQYSGWMMGFIYLVNALNEQDSELGYKARSLLCQEAVNDLEANNRFWDEYTNDAAMEAANNAYDSFIKSYGDDDGIKSYGLVVDLLVTYFDTGK